MRKGSKASIETRRKLSLNHKGFLGRKHTEETKQKMSFAHKGEKCYWMGKHRSLETKEKISQSLSGSKHWNWKDGISKDRKYLTDQQREYYHRLGISKKYYYKYGGSKPLTRRENNLIRKHSMRKGGQLTIQTIQRVYEDNIKQFGTLTCCLCLKPIDFGQDSLEHKQPISRGGTNTYDNLGIAHRRCNSIKGKKTFKEFKYIGD